MMKTNNSSSFFSSIRKHWPVIVLGALTVGLLVILFCWGGDYTIDDAFISYRYARHIANGHGIVWNIGGERTEGFTNFLFVILLAGMTKLGVSPVIGAHVLNAISSVAIGVLVFYLSGLILQTQVPWQRFVVASSIVLNPLFLQNALTGMETSFWTALLILGILFSIRYFQKRDSTDLLVSTLSMLAATLTRPETVAIWAIQTVILLSLTRQRRNIFWVSALLYVVPGLIFLIWKYTYFGYFLPNSFYLKVSDNESVLNGIRYVYGYFNSVGFLILSVGLIGLAYTDIENRKHFSKSLLKSIFLVSPLFLLWVIYSLSNPLMGTFSRFIYPAHIALLTISISLIVNMLGEDQILSRFLLIGVLGVVVALPSMKMLAKAIVNPRYDPLTAVEEKVGRALKNMPHHRDITVFLGDCGRIPYYSESIVIDRVGLNDNFIARASASENEIINYIFDRHPDLVSLFANPDHTLFTRHHGRIGGANERLYQRSIQEGYEFVAGFDAEWTHVLWFVKAESSYAKEITTGLQSIADWTTYEIRGLAND